MENTINIGIIGVGTVGSGVVSMLTEHKELLKAKVGLPLRVTKMVSRSFKLESPVEGISVGKDPREIIEDPEIDIVVELIGGLEPAKSYILDAITRGKAVVTANKLLISQHGFEILKIASERGVPVGFEGSVAGGIPIIRVIRDALIGNEISMVRGIVNGTCNYILTKMFNEKKEFETVLKEAQRLGYAEKDASLDVDGIDSAHKIAILSFLSFGTDTKFKDVYYEGITALTYGDLQYAFDMGHKIKLLGIAEKVGDKLSLRVHPVMLPKDSILAKIDGVYNAVEVIGDYTGPTIYIGKGAGSKPTASAVVSDIVDTARSIYQKKKTKKGFVFLPKVTEPNLMDISELRSKYYIRLEVVDKPGVLAAISGIFGNHDISLKYVLQIERHEGQTVPIVIMTHISKEKNIKQSLKLIEGLEVVTKKPVMIRAMDDETPTG